MIRDTRRADYTRPILIAVLATAVLITIYMLLEVRFFPNLTSWQSRILGVLMSCAMTALMAYLVLRLYRQMAQDSMDDLRERLRLSEELVEERNLVKSLLENSAERIFFKDLDGRYIRASSSVAQVFGLSHAGEVVGRSDFDFFEEDYARALRNDEQEVIRTSCPIVSRAYGERWKDGRETWASISMAPLRDRHGTVIGILGIARDITVARSQEERIRQLSRAVEQSPHMVIITSRQAEAIYVNPRFCKVTGFSKEEVLGKRIDVLHARESDGAHFEKAWEMVLEGKEWSGELLSRRKEGEPFWVRFAISPIRNAAGEITHMVSIAEDISREKEAAAAIQMEQQRRQELERIVTISPAIVFLWRNVPGWPVEYVSDNVEQWGYTAAELMRGDIVYSDLVHPDDLRRVGEEVTYYHEGGIFNFVQEYRILQKSGGVRWIEDRTWARRDGTGHVTHFQGVVLDITERKQAEEAQRELLDGLRVVLQLADELIACPDEDALYKRAVELARERLGLERCGILIRDGDVVRGTYGTGMNHETTDEHSHIFPIDEHWRERLRLRSPEERRWELVEEPYRIWQDGKFVERGVGWVGVTPIQTTAREPIGIFCNDAALSGSSPDSIKQEVVAVYCSLLGNVVARKRVEEQQRAAIAQQRDVMERTDRLNSLGLLAAGMAHEINNPLQGIMTHLRLVERDLSKDAAARTSLTMVERGIETIATLVRKLLYLGATEKGSETADLRECTDSVVQLLAHRFKRSHVTADMVYPAQRLLFAIPRSELTQILMNLMINACDAMPTGGSIRITSGSDGKYGFIRIEDSGPGISAEAYGKIFTPFFTTKGNKGTGLGLSVVESLVRGSHGTVNVESPPGHGAIFTLSLPLA
ncbi:MAG: PAS domain S-box protein [Kiritimatiellae bacterium]|nr:PAS domain S-box protein [Kiritimatiellia bacterium]